MQFQRYPTIETWCDLWIALFKILTLLLSVQLLISPCTNGDSFQKWRGLSKLEDMDMVEVATWMEGLADDMSNGLKYYWVNNDLYYPYIAIVRSIFGIFNLQFQSKNISSTFMDGCEALVHYMIMKSYPIEGRKGGVRGNGQDRQTLKAAIPHLKACFEKATGNFKDLIPSARRRKKRKKRETFDSQLFAQNEQGFTNLKSSDFDWYEKTVFTNESMSEESNSKSSEILEKDGQGHHHHRSNELSLNNSSSSSNDSSAEQGSDHEIHPRYTYTMYHGEKGVDKQTKIIMPDKEIGIENIATSVFWLLYEIDRRNCEWTKEEMETVMTAVDGIVALVLSLYMYDAQDFGEEYERIFKLSVPEYEAEWTKVEDIARSLSKEKDFTIRRPYTS